MNNGFMTLILILITSFVGGPTALGADSGPLCGCSFSGKPDIDKARSMKYVFEAVPKMVGDRMVLETKNTISGKPAKTIALDLEVLGLECSIEKENVVIGQRYLIGVNSEDAATGVALQISICDIWLPMADSGEKLKKQILTGKQSK